MKKISVPEKIQIIADPNRIQNNYFNGGLISSIDTNTKKASVARNIVPDRMRKANGTKLSEKAVIQLCSKKYNNLDGYKPTIGKGRIRDTIRNYDWYYTAPDGKIRLPLSETGLAELLAKGNISKGKITENCIICKIGTEYRPIIKTDTSIAKAIEAVSISGFVKPKDLNEGDKVIYRGEEFTYIGMYSRENFEYWGNTPRGHILLNLVSNRMIMKPHFGKELLKYKDKDASYQPKDYSIDLMLHNGVYNGYYTHYVIYGKNKRDLAATIKTMKLIPGPEKKIATGPYDHTQVCVDGKFYIAHVDRGRQILRLQDVFLDGKGAISRASNVVKEMTISSLTHINNHPVAKSIALKVTTNNKTIIIK